MLKSYSPTQTQKNYEINRLLIKSQFMISEHRIEVL